MGTATGGQWSHHKGGPHFRGGRAASGAQPLVILTGAQIGTTLGSLA